MVESGSLRLVCFELRDQELALPIGEVRETLPIQPITRVILTPPCLAGVFSLRGDIVPAIDLGVLLGLSRTGIDDHSRLVVIEHARGTAGIVVDRLRDLRTLDGPLEPPPSHLPPEVGALLLGLAATPSGTVRVLDARAILEAAPLRALAGEPRAEEVQP
ncbi:MAG: chemotaxis protein CheW [Kofleriaceae bacterium]